MLSGWLRAVVVPPGVRTETGWRALRVAGPLAALGAVGHRIAGTASDAGADAGAAPAVAAGAPDDG